jgi:hypothetical protein
LNVEAVGPLSDRSGYCLGAVLWEFKSDKEAGKMFVGKDCGLCTNSNWDVKSKGMDK